MKNFFKRSSPKYDLEFKDKTNSVYHQYPIRRAIDVEAPFERQQDKKSGMHFDVCPGLPDYKNTGFILEAWDDIHIKASSAGVMAYVGHPSEKDRAVFGTAKKMSSDIIKGIFTPKGDVPLTPLHFGSPWSIFTHQKNLSCYLMPAIYHSPFLEDLYVYPGVVDYSDKFMTVNFIAAPKRPCELTIRAGTPLLQIIPFYKQDWSAGYGNTSERDLHKIASKPASTTQWYRRYCKTKTKTKIQENFV